MNIRRTLECFLTALVLLLNSAKGNSPNEGPSAVSVCSGLPGIPGNPGHNGLPGRDGSQGQTGSDGTKGAKGDKGATGKTGPKGSLGEEGPIRQMGAKGEKGVKGNLGEPGPQGENGIINWKQCVWQERNGKDIGLIQECSYTKRPSSTALKVTYAASMKVFCSTSGRCCGRWYITFNGTECSGPMAIEGIVYVDVDTRYHLHRPNQIEGLCENIPSGLIRVAVHVGNCADHGTTDRTTGWNAVSRMIIEEYPESQTSTDGAPGPTNAQNF